jgi:isopentenyldiphosphate isomerase
MMQRMRNVMPDQNTASPPDELFDVLNADGSATGEVKRRADVHRDGDWHRAFHLWIAGRTSDGVTEVLFQCRSTRKDTWPRRLDIAVGGHYRAGETIHDVVREIDEEVGLTPRLEDLVYVGERRAESLNPAWQDREIQDVYVLALRSGWPRFAPNADEIESLLRVEAEQLLRLCRGETDTVAARTAAVIADRQIDDWQPTTIGLDDFVPTADGYLARGTRAALRVLAGETNVRLVATDLT